MVLAALALVLAIPLGDAGARGPERTQRYAEASIVGGRDGSIAELPWLAFVEATNRRGEVRQCTGTVVAPRAILTAAHCAMSIETGRMYAAVEYAVATGVGDLREATPANVFEVSQVLAFPQFSTSTLRNDAGLLILATPTTAPAIPMGRIAETRSLGPGTPLAIAGWGLTNGRSRQTPPVLQAAETVLQSAGFCRQRTASFYPFFSGVRQLCALEVPARRAATCKGDSGGPAIARLPGGSLAVVGITSLGAPNCSPRKPNVFTRVDQVVEWVDEWIAASQGLAPPPPIPRPRRRLPFLRVRTAKSLVAIALREDFRRRFRAGRGKRIRCGRVAREKVKCAVSWYRGPDDYFGTITVYLAVSENQFVWDARYRIRWVNHRCWFFGGNRRSCEIHVKSR